MIDSDPNQLHDVQVIPFPSQPTLTTYDTLEKTKTDLMIDDWYKREHLEQILSYLSNLTPEYLRDLCNNSVDEVQLFLSPDFIEDFENLIKFKYLLPRKQLSFLAMLDSIAFEPPQQYRMDNLHLERQGNFESLYKLCTYLTIPEPAREREIKAFFQHTKDMLLTFGINRDNGDREYYEWYLEQSIKVVLALADKIFQAYSSVINSRIES